jgi:photosystem II stability/assembly factor-like uncharacterized protein
MMRHAFRTALLLAGMSAAVGMGMNISMAGATTSNGAASPIPTTFKATSLSFINQNTGWVMGTQPCSGHICTRVIETTDGGHSWTPDGKIADSVARNQNMPIPGLTEIRFASPEIGWAYGNQLWATTNGGKRWGRRPLPSGAQQVLAFATGASNVYAVTSTCKMWTGECNQKPLSLWYTSETGGPWHRVTVALPASDSADLSAFGTSVYVVDTQQGMPDLFYASKDGVTFTARRDPCVRKVDIQLIGVVASSPSTVSLLCDGNPGFSKAQKYVFTSHNRAKNYEWVGQMGIHGIQAQLAVSPSGRYAVASWADGSFIYTNNGQTSKWTFQTAFSDGGRGWNDIQYVSNQTAWVVYSPASYFNGLGKLYVTRNGGKTWGWVTP